MVLENKLGITSSSELANVEEKISKKKAIGLALIICGIIVFNI